MWRRCPESRVTAWRCPISIKATDFRLAAWRRWTSRTAWCRQAAWASISTAACGVGGAGFIKIGAQDLERVLARGAGWMVENGYGEERDARFAEAGGALEGADAAAVSSRAKERGLPQLGTLGSGNHFLEVQYVEEIHDEVSARAFGIAAGQVVVLIHSGSRGL